MTNPFNRVLGRTIRVVGVTVSLLGVLAAAAARRLESRASALALGLLTSACGDAGIAGTSEVLRIEAGPLTLETHVSKTAQLFQVVDQISQWSEFCHPQYSRYFEALDGGLSAADHGYLVRHSGVGKAHGWGSGLEQTFYTSLELEAALAEGVRGGWLTEREAQTERDALLHFQRSVEALMVEERSVPDAFQKQLSGQRTNLAALAQTLSRFGHDVPPTQNPSSGARAGTAAAVGSRPGPAPGRRHALHSGNERLC